MSAKIIARHYRLILLNIPRDFISQCASSCAYG